MATRIETPLWRSTPPVFLSLAGVAAGITLLFLGMRAVMQIGGACAEGGPFVPVQPCPDGIPVLMVGGIWGGIIFVGLYVWQTIKHDVPSLVLFAWPALFLSLGWNFFEFGFNPQGDVGPAWAWLFCGVVFVLLGGVPLLVFLGGRALVGTVREKLRAPTRPLSGVRVAVGERPPADLVDELERLDRLHRSGALSDEEFEAAKRKLLRR